MYVWIFSPHTRHDKTGRHEGGGCDTAYTGIQATQDGDSGRKAGLKKEVGEIRKGMAHTTIRHFMKYQDKIREKRIQYNKS